MEPVYILFLLKAERQAQERRESLVRRRKDTTVKKTPRPSRGGLFKLFSSLNRHQQPECC